MFAFSAAHHQFLDSLARRSVLVQDCVYLIGDRHFDAAGLRQFCSRGRGEDTFGNSSAHGGQNFSKLAAATQFNAHASVPRKRAGTSQNQIAEARQSGHGFDTAPAGNNEPRHFRKSARDQASDGVVAQPEAIADSGGNGDHILERTA
jgi:hypothetical protein